jgi:hypothetical protein
MKTRRTIPAAPQWRVAAPPGRPLGAAVNDPKGWAPTVAGFLGPAATA